MCAQMRRTCGRRREATSLDLEAWSLLTKTTTQTPSRPPCCRVAFLFRALGAQAQARHFADWRPGLAYASRSTSIPSLGARFAFLDATFGVALIGGPGSGGPAHLAPPSLSTIPSAPGPHPQTPSPLWSHHIAQMWPQYPPPIWPISESILVYSYKIKIYKQPEK